jgi:hypothetical protein
MSHRSRFAILAALACALVVLVTPLGALWISGGVPLCTLPYNQEDLVIASDGAGGAIIAWEGPHSTDEWDIFCQRLSNRGAPLWTENGAAVCDTAGAQTMTAIASDGAGGAYLCWTDRRYDDWDVFAQRIGANGSPLWNTYGIPIARLEHEQSNNQIISDGAGGAIIVWHSYYEDSGWDILAQRVTADGDVLWTKNGNVVCNAVYSQVFPQMVSDGSGGAIIVWQDGRTAIADHIYAQRIAANGDLVWTADGVAVCTAGTGQNIPHVTSDGAGGAIVTWYDYRNGWADIYAQRLNAAGTPLWMVDGVAICNASREQYNPRIASDGAGGAIITWYDYRSDTNYDIYAQRVSAAGAVLWTADGVAVCTRTGDQKDPQIVSDGVGGAIIAWDFGDINAQRLDSSGTPLWTANGIIVCPSTGSQQNAALLSKGADGVIVAWEDDRSGTSDDIYAALLGADGALVSTLIAGWDAAYREGAIAVEWKLTELVPRDRLAVSRRGAAAAGGPWGSISAEIENAGLNYKVIDASCEPGASYIYRVDILEDGATRTLFETDAISTPALSLVLNQNHPNPFNPSTTISFSMPRESAVTLEIFDGAGRLVVGLLDGDRLRAGPHEVEWNGRDSAGRTCATGIYLYRLIAGKEKLSRKMVLLR